MKPGRNPAFVTKAPTDPLKKWGSASVVLGGRLLERCLFMYSKFETVCTNRQHGAKVL